MPLPTKIATTFIKVPVIFLSSFLSIDRCAGSQAMHAQINTMTAFIAQWHPSVLQAGAHAPHPWIGIFQCYRRFYNLNPLF
jgi:hypothetical protein